ncbi:MAG TPA: GNAT family N-acetyltransferase [Caldilineaceae bacterium]|nr:GNAT family N-acetyltransferase [Caldilineaceae bacterium]
MPVVKASLLHLVGVRRLLKEAFYRYVDAGAEDLPHLLAHASGAVGEENGRAWGFLSVQLEDRPSTLPPDAPTRAYLKVLAALRPFHPGDTLRRLLPLVEAQFGRQPGGVQIISYGADHWLEPALLAAGFVEVERVQFYQLDRLARRVEGLPPLPPLLNLTPGHPDFLDELARLDAAAFPPLWHFGTKDLFELLMRGRVQLAWRQGVLAGYSAICANSSSEGQLARLAVHPDFQGQGIGRGLLSDAVAYAANEFSVLILNTQLTNTRSQTLYKGFGFRPIGAPVPVLARWSGWS